MPYNIWRPRPTLVPRFFTGERVGQRVFLQVLVTGIVANRKQKISSQVIGKIMFNQPVISTLFDCSEGICDIIIQHVLIP